MTERRNKKGLDNVEERESWEIRRDKLLVLAERIYLLQHFCCSLSHFPLRQSVFFSPINMWVSVHLLSDNPNCPSQRLIRPVRDYLLPM